MILLDNRRSVSLTVLLVAAACGKPDQGARTQSAGVDTVRAPSARELAYVTNEDSQDLTVIDTHGETVIATIPVGTRPRGVKVSPDGRTVFVALSGSPKCPPSMPDEECEKLKSDKSKDGIAQVDIAGRRVTRILPGGSDPEQFDINRDGSLLYVSNEDAGTASIVEVATGRIRMTVPVGVEPEGVRLSPDGKTFHVTAETDHVVTTLDAETGKNLGQVEVGRRPRDLAFLSDGRLAYVTAEVEGTVSVIDVPHHSVLTVIRLPEGARPMGVVVSPDDQRVYVATGRGGTIEVIDVATNQIVGSVKVGQRPWGLALTEDGRKLYTANGPSNDVSVVDTQTLQVLKTIPAGKIPWGVAIGLGN